MRVVYCRDCKYIRANNHIEVNGKPLKICDFWHGTCRLYPDGYCSAAEKRMEVK